MLGLIGLLLFAAVQGAVVFATAFVANRIVGADTRAAKAVTMTASYVGWVAITIGGYAALGGDGGLMDGFGFVLVLCFTALISSGGYLIAWTSRA